MLIAYKKNHEATSQYVSYRIEVKVFETNIVTIIMITVYNAKT